MLCPRTISDDNGVFETWFEVILVPMQAIYLDVKDRLSDLESFKLVSPINFFNGISASRLIVKGLR